VIFGEIGLPLLLIQPLPIGTENGRSSAVEACFIPVEIPSRYGITSQNCDALWPSGRKNY